MILHGVHAATNAVNARTLTTFTPYSDTDKFDHQKIRAQNAVTFQLEFDHVIKLFTSRFKWDLSAFDVPNNYLENNIFYSGVMACFKHPFYGYLLMPCSISRYNFMGLPVEIIIQAFTSFDMIGFPYTTTEFVLMYDNPAMTLPVSLFRKYAFDVSDVARSCEVYQNGMKKPIIMAGNFNKAATLNRIVNQKLSNEYYVTLDTSTLKDNGLSPDLKPFFNTSHNAADLKGLFMHKQNLYDEMLRKMGICSNTINKAAQVNNEEVNKSDTMAKLVLASSLECRLEANRKIAEFAGKNITCEIPIELVNPFAAETPTNENS